MQKRRNFPNVVHMLIFDKTKTSDCTQYVQKSLVSNGSVVITWTKGWINDEVLSHCWLGVRKSIRPEIMSDEVFVSGAWYRLFAADATVSKNPIISCLI